MTEWQWKNEMMGLWNTRKDQPKELCGVEKRFEQHLRSIVRCVVCGVSVLVVATSGLWQHATLSTLCSAQAVTLRSTKLKSMHANGHEVSEIYKGTVCVYA